jgi:hypothetical protein
MRRLAALLALGLVAAMAFAAEPVRLDDTASPRSRVEAQPRWLHTGEGLGNPEMVNAMIAQVANLEVRLNTARFVGKSARVFLVFPDFVPGIRSRSGIRAEWRTRGVLLPGSALPGTRTLVYDGPITKPFLSDFLDLSLFLDARYLDTGARFEPVFELELAP